jgi:hypothetical protein
MARPLLSAYQHAATQFAGCSTHTTTWNSRIVQPSSWGNQLVMSSPSEIISQFRNRRYTQGLALVISWGGMGRTSKHIYADQSRETIQKIENRISDCADSISKSHSVSSSWQMLTGVADGQLGWSEVMASKTLHFLSRSLGFDRNPPVALDGGRIRKRVWPMFSSALPSSERPRDWEGRSFDVYSRYMTAVLTWAGQKGWTTTETEATLVHLADAAA